MNARQLLAELERRGVELSLESDGSIRFRAPIGVLTEELRAEMIEHKPGLRALLKARRVDG